MVASTYKLLFDGGVLARGFWIYVWEVTKPNGERLYYVGRTGDSSSNNAQSPFNRMGQHLGFAENSAMLRRHLLRYNVEPESCRFRLVSHGPILEEADEEDKNEHERRRDIVAAIEKALQVAMGKAGYTVMNEVKCLKPLDNALFDTVSCAFAETFGRLSGVRI